MGAIAPTLTLSEAYQRDMLLTLYYISRPPLSENPPFAPENGVISALYLLIHSVIHLFVYLFIYFLLIHLFVYLFIAFFLLLTLSRQESYFSEVGRQLTTCDVINFDVTRLF